MKDNNDDDNNIINEEKKEELINNKNKTDYLEDLQRLQAEFENFVKRSETEKQELLKYSTEKLVVKLLSVLDSFELALRHNNDDGVKLIYLKLFSLLESEGLSKISSEGIFNPKLHEALSQEKGEIDNKIVEELQTGYMLGEKVIRYAKVKIIKVKQ